jgi:hypothetical protein
VAPRPGNESAMDYGSEAESSRLSLRLRLASSQSRYSSISWSGIPNASALSIASSRSRALRAFSRISFAIECDMWRLARVFARVTLRFLRTWVLLGRRATLTCQSGGRAVAIDRCITSCRVCKDAGTAFAACRGYAPYRDAKKTGKILPLLPDLRQPSVPEHEHTTAIIWDQVDLKLVVVPAGLILSVPGQDLNGVDPLDAGISPCDSRTRVHTIAWAPLHVIDQKCEQSTYKHGIRRQCPLASQIIGASMQRVIEV